jgi:5-methylcytosine-specific restriction protein B
MIWALYLFVDRSMGPETKRIQIRRIWEWSGEPLPDRPLELDRAFQKGIGATGTAYATRRWAEFQFFIAAMEDWKQKTRAERERLLNEPWGFAEWLEGISESQNRQFRHVLLYYLFPETFERIASSENKRQIVRAFQKELSDLGAIDLKRRIDVDRALLTLRERLEARQPGQTLDFYDVEAIRATWSTPAPGASQPEPKQSDLDRWYQDKFGKARVWVIAAGEGGRLWPSSNLKRSLRSEWTVSTI